MDDTSNILSVLGWVALVIGLIYIGGPVAIKFSQKMNPSPPFQRFDPNQLPMHVAPFFHSSVQALLADGFVVIDYLTAPNWMPNVVPCVVYLIHPHTRDKANVSCIWATVDGVTKPRAMYVEMSTRFANGNMIDTNNSKTVGSFKYGPEKKTYRFVDVADPRMLFQLHQFIISREEPSTPRVLPPPGQEIPTFLRSIAEDYELQSRNGLLTYDAAENVFKPTWRGAFSMTWGQLFPLLQISRSKMKAKTDAVLSDFRRNGGVPTGAGR